MSDREIGPAGDCKAITQSPADPLTQSTRPLTPPRAGDGTDVFRHVWHNLKWPYIQPVHDAQADTMRVENYLADPSAVLAEQGRDADDVRDRTIAFNKSCIVAAIKAAQEIKKETQVEVHWRDVYNRAVPKGGQVIDMVEEENTIGGRKKAAGEAK